MPFGLLAVGILFGAAAFVLRKREDEA